MRGGGSESFWASMAVVRRGEVFEGADFLGWIHESGRAVVKREGGRYVG